MSDPAPNFAPPVDGVHRPPARRLRYAKLGDLPSSPADYPMLAIEAALARIGVRHRVCPATVRGRDMMRAAAKLRAARPILRLGRTAYLVPTGQVGEGRYVPLTYFNEVVPLYFDAWPNLWPQIGRVLRRHRVRVAFFTARQSADHFRAALGIDALWVPEACDPAAYRPDKPLADRPVDVLELGRKLDRYHDAITPALAAAGRAHQYERARGQMIFATRDAMVDGLANAKISVCFPSSMTHPDRSGHVETVTHRYFESMASKCLIVGHCPAELADVMGYNPVIEADLSSPTASAAQIAALLADAQHHQEMADRNYQAMLARGTWDARVASILELLAARGYVPDTTDVR